MSSWNVKECDPSGSCAHYLVENAGGVLDEYDDKRGVVNTFDHDNLGRITKAHYDVNGLLGHGTMNDSYTYDLANRLTGIVHASQGTPCGGNTDSFTYDGLDDVLTTCAPEGSLVYHYDLIGRETSMQPPSPGQLISYTPDDANELTAVSTTSTSAGLSYTADGQRQELTVNNVTSAYAYDPASERLCALYYNAGGTPLSNWTCTGTTGTVLGNLTYSYRADSTVSGKAGSLAVTNLPSASSATAVYADTNQIKTWTNGVQPTVDAANNLKSDPTSISTYQWDARNEMLSLTAGSAVTDYTYDAGGRRETVAAAGQTTAYLYDGVTPVQITAGSTSTNIVAIPGSNEVLSIAGIVPIHDALGSVLGGINSAGALQYQYTYDPFGNFTTSGQPPSGYGNVYGMAGIEIDPTGLYHANARYYNPALTRFVSEDPQRGKANMFTYAGNGPIGNSDTSGMWDYLYGDYVPVPAETGFFDYSPVLTDLPIVGAFIGLFWDSSAPTPTFVGRQMKVQFGRTFASAGIQDGVVVSSPTGGKAQGPLVASGSAVAMSVWAGTAAVETAGEVACPECDVAIGIGLAGWAAYILYKNAFEGPPNSTVSDGQQTRRYGPDGFPQTDVDTGHSHNGLRPHAHDWGRPAGGGKPSKGDRGPGRPLQPGDPPLP
ncbi:MAG TPA: RHS repeat-associated core domain-containing protein [Candidatus Binataceae bacterium]